MIPDEFNDYPVIAAGAIDSFDIYDSFLKCKELSKTIPKKHLGDDPDYSLSKLLNEFHSMKKSGKTLFRRSGGANEALSFLWLSRVNDTARLYSLVSPIPDFKGITQDDLFRIARLSVDVSSIRRIDKILHELGILCIYEPAIPSMKLDGAVYTMKSGNPVIGLSLRYARVDNFWFTLMHELSHICLHYEKLESPILDDLDESSSDVVEIAADKLAANSLIHRSAWRSFQVHSNLDESEIVEFARKNEVHPAVVAGRIRKELNRYDLFSNIVNETNTREIFGQHV